MLGNALSLINSVNPCSDHNCPVLCMDGCFPVNLIFCQHSGVFQGIVTCKPICSPREGKI